MSNLTDNAWVQRVGEIRQLASDAMGVWGQLVADYNDDERFIREMVAESGLTDEDEVRVLRAEIERLMERNA